MMPRFSYIQMMHREFRKGKMTPEALQAKKEDLCMCMLTTTDEWDTYANRRDHTHDMEETAEWLREQGFLA